MQFSKWLAIVGGVLAPALETIRRWSTWKQSPANLFDDYIMGALLLYGAWRVGKDVRSVRRTWKEHGTPKGANTFHPRSINIPFVSE